MKNRFKSFFLLFNKFLYVKNKMKIFFFLFWFHICSPFILHDYYSTKEVFSMLDFVFPSRTWGGLKLLACSVYIYSYALNSVHNPPEIMHRIERNASKKTPKKMPYIKEE